MMFLGLRRAIVLGYKRFILLKAAEIEFLWIVERIRYIIYTETVLIQEIVIRLPANLLIKYSYLDTPGTMINNDIMLFLVYSIQELKTPIFYYCSPLLRNILTLTFPQGDFLGNTAPTTYQISQRHTPTCNLYYL